MVQIYIATNRKNVLKFWESDRRGFALFREAPKY